MSLNNAQPRVTVLFSGPLWKDRNIHKLVSKVLFGTERRIKLSYIIFTSLSNAHDVELIRP